MYRGERGKLLVIAKGISLLALSLLSYTYYQPIFPPSGQHRQTQTESVFERTLHFNIYTFTVETSDTGSVRDASIKVWRGQLLLTNFKIPIDGAIAGVEVADLDNNRFPELYVFGQSSGSGSFGRVYGWQFLPERKADITLPNWRLPADTGYMGHDSIWVDQNNLCRQFPRYQTGDANASPTGGTGMTRYQLRPAGQGFVMVAL